MLAAAGVIPYTVAMTDATGPRPPSAIAEFAAAVMFLTRIPIGWRGEWPADLDQRALAWFPIVGALIGGVGGALYWAAASVGLPPWLAALAAVGGLAWLTGALHEDGLADVADGFGGGRDKARKLEIMKDSRVGTYGALALLLAVTAKIGALASLADPRTVALALIGAHAFSRGVLPALKAALPDARTDGVSATQGRPNSARAVVAAVIGLTLGATALGEIAMPAFSPLVVVLVSLLPVLLLARMARRQIGGITGDVLGAAQQLAEIGFLLALVAILG